MRHEYVTAATQHAVANTINSTATDHGSPTGPLTACNISLFTHESNTAIEEFRRLVDDGAIFVYMKLVFMDVEFEDPLSAYLEDIGNIIDPLTWVWAKGESRGKLLLASPFDFNQLSLTTLSAGVFSLTVKMQSSGCIDSERADGDKIQAIARLLLDLVKGTNEDDQTDDTNNEEIVCLEKQLGKDAPVSGIVYSPGSSYTMMQASTAFDCWSNGADNKVTRVHTESWLTWILAGGVILALFSPMAMSFFIQKNPPEKDENGIERLSLVSDLPLGLKHVTCFWANNNILVASTRWTVFILLFTLTQYIPVLISFLTDMDGFMKRSYALYNTGPLNPVISVVSHILVNVVFVLASIVLLVRLVRDAGQQSLEPLLRERAVRDGAAGVHVEDDNIASYRHFVLVDAPEELWTPSISLERSQAFFYYMSWRASMVVDINAWKFVLYGLLWRWISEHVGAPPDNKRTAVCAMIFVILYPFYLPFGLIIFSFNSLPLMYSFTRCLQFAFLSNIVKCSELFFAFLIAIASIAWFFKFVATFVYVSEIIVYFFIGFIINANLFGWTILGFVTMTGYIIQAITGFYDGYCVLFMQVMEIAKDVDEKIKDEKAEGSNQVALREGSTKVALRKGRFTRQARVSSSGDIGMISMGGEHEETNEHVLVKDNALDGKLFWLIVEKYQPIKMQVTLTFLQLFAIIIGIVFGMYILFITDSMSNLATSVKFVSMFIIAAVPKVLLSLKSPASQTNYDEAKKMDIEGDILHFAKNRELRCMVP